MEERYSGLYSHPDKPLEVHLEKVAHLAKKNGNRAPVDNLLESLGLSRAAFEQLITICGYCHDLGKATGFFQEYLFAAGNKKKELKGMKETKHSFFSAMATYWAAKTALSEMVNEEGKALFAFFAFLAVRRHHGNLKSVITEATILDEDVKLLVRQAGSIDRSAYNILSLYLVGRGVPDCIDLTSLEDKFRQSIEEFDGIRRKIRRLGRSENLLYYFFTNLLFSLLIDADKSAVGVGDKLPERSEISLNPQLVDEFKQQLERPRHVLDPLREKAYREALANPIDLNRRIFSLNLPTGLGKTFTAVAFSFKLREQVHKENGYYPRIVYSLPFLSIIEQNASEIEKILSSAGTAVDSSLLLKHHFFTDLQYKKGEDEFEPQEAKILLEGWNTEIVVTTFVQLFHTLVGHRNRNLRKFHRLAGSIIILDEVQAIPFKFWELVKETLEKLACQLDSYILFVTATEPLIFPHRETVPLVDRDPYYRGLNRVTVKPQIKEEKTIEELADEIDWNRNNQRLFIFNTISAAKSFYHLVEEKTGEKQVYLSTHVTPKERLQRVEVMRKKKVPLAVTTQLVEAGVDIDFEEVHRDLAPLDSINQSAGRANRHGDGSGQVFVHLLHDGRRTYASYIYDAVLLEITREILGKHNTIPERDFLQLIETYYRLLLERKSLAASKGLLKSLYKLDYDSSREGDSDPGSISSFRLIEEDYPKIDVFIEIDPEAADVWKEYQRIKEIPNLLERKQAFAGLKSRFFQYVISVPSSVANLPPEVSGFRYVGRESLKEYYDPVTGFKTQGVVSLW